MTVTTWNSNDLEVDDQDSVSPVNTSSLNQWIPANHLKTGEYLKTPDGQAAVVVGGSVPADHDGWMWDLTVPGNNDHDFYVLPTEASEHPHYANAAPVLVHNENAGAEDGGCPIAGSGTTEGILEVSGRVKSVGALRNFNPSTSRDFIFDAQSNRFATGADQGVGGHDFLRMAIGSSEDNPSLVGDRILGRGENGEFIKNEWSGHYGGNWTDTIRQQFSEFMNQYGLTVQHNVGFGTGQ